MRSPLPFRGFNGLASTRHTVHVNINQTHRYAALSQRRAVDGVRPGIISITALNREAPHAVGQEKSLSWLKRGVGAAARNRDDAVFAILGVVLYEDSTGGNLFTHAPE